MVQSGGWCKLRTPDEHTKLARVALSFSPKLDEAFKVNVAKMSVQLPTQIRDNVQSVVATLARLARERYDKREAKTTQRANPTGTHVTVARTGAGGSITRIDLPSAAGPAQSIEPASIFEIEELALRFAEQNEKSIVEKIFRRIHEHYKEKVISEL